MARKITRKVQNSACADDADPNALPIVSGKEGVGGMSTVLTAVLIDGDKVWWDDAACHGRTPLEQEIEWQDRPEDVPGARTVYVAWVFIKPDRQSRQYVYHGVTGVDMRIDAEAGKGYKRLGHHANMLGEATKGTVDLSAFSEAAKAKLVEALNQYPEVLENSGEALHEALGAFAKGRK